MRGIFSTSVLSSLATVAGLLATAEAGELKPTHARTIDLGTVRGVAYYTVEKDGYRVVATIEPDGAVQPVRVVAVLAPEQTLRLSVPGSGAGPESAVAFSRHGDDVTVSDVSQSTN